MNLNGLHINSTLNLLTERLEAKYFYLPHGPLARVELGKKSIQGLDYAYTLQGWLKDINGYRVDINSTGVYDIGEDGSNTNYVNKRFGRDLFSSMIQFYQTDYSPISGNNYFNLVSTNSIDLYNGNISAISVGIKNLDPLLKSYCYDKINRIKVMTSAGLNNSVWGTLSNLFGSTYSYDFNGNIESLIRYDENGNLLHNIRYTYSADRNRLSSIIVSGTGIGSSSYQYDALGNLIRDNNENINVTWNVIGKVKSVQTPNNMLSFAYNPFGQRQIKRTASDSTYYIHDATGNVMSIYVKDYPKIVAKERPIYGSSRLGIMTKEVEFNLTGNFLSKSNSTIGIKEYELCDHLSNVSVVVLDRKECSISVIKPIVKTHTDYYPFGYPISSRTDNVDYRYGFNGQEGDNEIYGDKKCYSYEFRNYDSRIGRWWGIDNLYKQFPWTTPYSFVENDVIRKKDVGGKYGSDGHYWTVYAMGLMIGLTNDEAIKWAIAAEYYDNTVIMSSSLQNTIFIDKLTWLPGPLQYLHGLTGEYSSGLKSDTKKQILGGNINDSHTFGDAYAHATKSSNYTILYSAPWGHAGSNEDPDNIGKHPKQYLSYVKDFASILKTATGKTGAIDFAVYEEVSKSQSEEVRTGILQSYIASKNGQQLILSYSIELEKSLKNLNIEYSITTKTEEIVSSLKYGETYTITTKTITINEKK